MDFKDYFSGQAADYAVYRPHYPAELFTWLAQQCPHHECAWDCATGNGQAAIALTPYFQHVIATDGSAAQLQHAPPHPQIDYRVALAESSGLAAHSIDLITVAQAVHWFDLDPFYREVKRILKPNGTFAIWCYGRPQLSTPALDDLLKDYYSHTLDDFWTPERRLVEDGYRTLPFPFQSLDTPQYTLQVTWALPALMGYLYTWSATQRFIATHQINPLQALSERFVEAGAGDRVAIAWPISLRAGKSL